MKNLHLIDDGFGNLLEAAGRWYFEHKEAPLPKGMIRANYSAAVMFYQDDWHEPAYAPRCSVEIQPGLWAQRGGPISRKSLECMSQQPSVMLNYGEVKIKLQEKTLQVGDCYVYGIAASKDFWMEVTGVGTKGFIAYRRTGVKSHGALPFISTTTAEMPTVSTGRSDI